MIRKTSGKKNITYKLFNTHGMALLEFVIVILAVFFVMVSFIEAGYVLKSETMVVGVTKNVAREISLNGQLSPSYKQDVVKLMKSLGLVADVDSVIVYTPKNMDNDGVRDGIVSTGYQMQFRQKFRVMVKAKHRLVTLNNNLSPVSIDAPVMFFANGSVERFQYPN